MYKKLGKIIKANRGVSMKNWLKMAENRVENSTE